MIVRSDFFMSVDVMVTKSSGDTLIVFMDKNSNEPVTYFKVN